MESNVASLLPHLYSTRGRGPRRERHAKVFAFLQLTLLQTSIHPPSQAIIRLIVRDKYMPELSLQHASLLMPSCKAARNGGRFAAG